MEYSYRDELYHHGIKGQKWGVRRFQNDDGTWTAAGKERYGETSNGDKVSSAKVAYKSAKKEFNKSYNNAYFRDRSLSLSKKKREESRERWEDVFDKSVAMDKAKQDYKNAKKESALTKKISKMESKVDKYNETINSAREKNRSRLEKKGVSKESLKDFDKGTKFVKSGQKSVKKVVDNYKSMQLSAMNNSSVKKTAEYKSAVSKFKEVSRNIPMATLKYTMEAAVSNQTAGARTATTIRNRSRKGWG